MGTVTRHMCISVSGMLRRVKSHPDEFVGVCTNDDGRVMTPGEVEEFLLGELDKGHKVIPACACDNFDYSGPGCLGHPVVEEGAAS